MRDFLVIKKNSISTVVICGLLLRLLFLLVIIVANEHGIESNIITDDITYELGAKSYISSASSIFDLSSYKIGFLTNNKPFYPWFICIVAYIFKTVWAIRVVNIALSIGCCILIYKTLLNYVSDESALLGAKLYAFLPYPLMMSCFVIKDVFLTFGFLYVLFATEKVKHEGISRTKKHIIITVLLLIAMYFTRGGLVESLLLIEAASLIIYLFKNGRRQLGVLCILLGIALLGLYGNSIIEAFSTKVSDYSDYGRISTGIASLRIDSITQIWKLPLTYAFAMLQPVMLSLRSGNTVWIKWVSGLNITMVPIAIANMCYLVFCKKKYKFFYWANFALYCSVIILVLNIFRHYFFLLPISFFNCALFNEYVYEKECWGMKRSCFFISAGMMLLLLMIMIVN